MADSEPLVTLSDFLLLTRTPAKRPQGRRHLGAGAAAHTGGPAVAPMAGAAQGAAAATATAPPPSVGAEGVTLHSSLAKELSAVDSMFRQWQSGEGPGGAETKAALAGLAGREGQLYCNKRREHQVGRLCA